jgi:hypothetical protein
MIMKKNIMIILICLGFLIGTSNVAWTVTFFGYFNDPGNSALIGSDLGSASFADDDEIAGNIFLYNLNITVDGNVSFISKGYAAGGAEPYFSLFQGVNRDSATFLDSNYSISEIDFSLNKYLTIGSYWIALGVWENMSIAENYGSGTLGDGFTGLGVPGYLGNYYYELEVTQTEQPVPEPGTILFTLLGLAGLMGLRKKSRQ